MTKLTLLLAGAMLTLPTIAMADPGPKADKPDRYELIDGTTHATPGAMFQYIRDRDNGWATGNPKDIVDAYPDEFDNVGDLIAQKRID